MSEGVLVIGAGTMGVGIVQVLLEAGARVDLVEPNTDAAIRARDRLGARDGLRIHSGIEAGFEVSLAIEVVPENLGLKKKVLAAIEVAVPQTCIVASNTSSLSIDALSADLQRPEQFVGMHFFNPVPRSLLVEVVTGAATAVDTVAAARKWVARIGKEHIEVRDSPGFATSRLGLAIGLEAIRMVEERVASPKDIDRGMELGYKFPIGPLRLTDLVGLDVRLAIAEHLAAELGPRFEPPNLLREMVAKGELGKKNGKGFYEWS